MSVHIRPTEIDVPEENPFKNDLLNRRESVQVLTNVTGSLQGPFVLAIDAGWGFGKTTFLRMWSTHLRGKGYPVVTINAWETDFSGNPFMALSCEILEVIEQSFVKDESNSLEEVRNAAVDLISKAAPIALLAATSGVSEIVGIFLKEIYKTYSENQNDKFSPYREAKESIKEFKCKLEELSNSISTNHDGKPLIIMIDELDRCRPPYTVELLEVAKHLYSVPNIIFVLSINRNELNHSIKALYGHQFDATRYLKKFIDIDYKLPDPDRRKYIDQLLNKIGIYSLLQRRNSYGDQYDLQELYELLRTIFSKSSLSFREIEQSVIRFLLVISSISTNQSIHPSAVAVALILRAVNIEIYYEFAKGQATDLDVINNLYEIIGPLTDQEKKTCVEFEVNVIISFWEVTKSYNDEIPSSPLFDHYSAISEKLSSKEEMDHAEIVVKKIEDYHSRMKTYNFVGIGFEISYDRIELLEKSLSFLSEDSG